MNLKLKWHSPDQAQIFHEDQTRYIVASLGRKYGKTLGAVQWLLEQGLKKKISSAYGLRRYISRLKLPLDILVCYSENKGYSQKTPISLI